MADIGWILVNDSSDTLCSETLNTLKKNDLAEGVVEFKAGKEITDMFEMLDGPMEGSVGYYNPASVLFLIMLIPGMGKCSTSDLPRCVLGPNQRRFVPFWRSRARYILNVRYYKDPCYWNHYEIRLYILCR
jgi:hypothetical protein